jgi:predicted nucleotidyltransferase
MESRNIQNAVSHILEGIVKHSDPERVVLFGSAARPSEGFVNDLDFLVVVRDSQSPSAVTDTLNLNIRHKPMPCDFLVATPAILRKHRGDKGSVYTAALRDGREVYAK